MPSIKKVHTELAFIYKSAYRTSYRQSFQAGITDAMGILKNMLNLIWKHIYGPQESKRSEIFPLIMGNQPRELMKSQK